MTKTFKTILGLILAWALAAQAGVVIAQSPNITSMHTAATATGNGTALIVSGAAGNPANTIGAAGIQIANSAGTFTITFETLTSGSTWTAVMATNMTDDVRATTATAAGQYTILLGGAVQLRARISACSSCSVTVVGRLVPGLVARVASGGGGGGSGTVTSVGWTGGIVSVATATTTPAFTIAGTSGGVPYFSSASTWATSAALAANAIVIGGGAGVAPSTTTTGTGVLTFLGTPSSANLASALTDETGGSGLAVFNSTPTIITPSFTTGFTIGGVAATGTIPRGNGTNFVASAYTMAAPGTTGNVLTSDGTNWLSSAPAAGVSGANPTASVGLTAVNGSASTFLRSDGAPPLDQGITPTWTGAHAFSNTITQTSASATAFQSGPNGGTNPVFRLVNSTASAATGLSITGNAAGSGVLLTALSSGTNEDLLLVGKGTGHVGSNKNGGVAIGIQISGQSFVGIGRNSSVGGMNINGGNSDSDTAVQMNINTLGLLMDGTFLLGWASTNVTQARDLTLRRVAAANLAFGAADAASPVAQTLSVQNVVAGTSNTVGVDWTKKASAGTGTGVGGAHVWQVAPAGSSGTTQNSFVEAMRITGAGVIQFPTTITAGGTTGNQTIDKVSGTVNIAAAGTTVTVTNNKVTANSTCFGVLRTNDATAALKNIVPGAGSFVITLTAATTAETSIGFFCINP